MQGGLGLMLTVRENIMLDIVAALKAITTDNGFDNDLSNVFRYSDPSATLNDPPVVLVKAGAEDDKDETMPLTSCNMEIYLLVYIRVDDASDDNPSPAPDITLNSILGDIKKKLVQDCGRGGNAVDTKFTRIETFESIKGQSEFGLIITMEVEYRHKETDPKTAM
jgi:hypothetical protein